MRMFFQDIFALYYNVTSIIYHNILADQISVWYHWFLQLCLRGAISLLRSLGVQYTGPIHSNMYIVLFCAGFNVGVALCKARRESKASADKPQFIPSCSCGPEGQLTTPILLPSHGAPNHRFKYYVYCFCLNQNWRRCGSTKGLT